LLITDPHVPSLRMQTRVQEQRSESAGELRKRRVGDPAPEKYICTHPNSHAALLETACAKLGVANSLLLAIFHAGSDAGVGLQITSRNIPAVCKSYLHPAAQNIKLN